MGLLRDFAEFCGLIGDDSEPVPRPPLAVSEADASPHVQTAAPVIVVIGNPVFSSVTCAPDEGCADVAE